MRKSSGSLCDARYEGVFVVLVFRLVGLCVESCVDTRTIITFGRCPFTPTCKCCRLRWTLKDWELGNVDTTVLTRLLHDAC